MSLIYTQEVFIPFHLADPAGIVFFGHVFSIVHEVYEQLIQEQWKIPWETWFKNPDWIVPIKQTQASYHYPLQAGLTYTIQVSQSKVGQTSFSLHYEFLKNEQVHCRVEVVHVFCDTKTKSKQPIPPFIQKIFKNFE